MKRRRFLALLGLGGLGGAATRVAGSVLRTASDKEPAPSTDEVEDPSSGQQRIIWSVDTEKPLAALTFDDGPDPDFTPRILDHLDRFGVKATFFVMGYNAVRHPELLREVMAAGHEIGSHGWSHLNLAEATGDETRREIEFGTRVIEEKTGVPVTVFRPPYGRFGESAVRLLAVRPVDMVVWSITRGELAWREPERIASHIVGALQPGDIIDLHDGIGRGTFNRGSEGAARLQQRRTTEVEALPRILDGLGARGVRLGTVSDLIAETPASGGA